MTAIVEVSGLTVRFGDFTAVHDVSFTVARGEIFGFLGANGAGKTTTIRVLCGLLLPSSGSARVAGIDIEKDSDAAKRRVGYMSQKFTLYDDLSVAENLAFTAGLRKLDSKVADRRTRELFLFVGFDRAPGTLVRDLPGGTKQQVSLAAALLHDPDVIFLDEPTAGVAPAARARFWTLIRRLAASGKTVFVTTHYMDEAEQCDRIALMRSGEIIALESPALLKKRAFPHAILEIETPPEAGRDWLTQAKNDSAIDSIQPHGMRHHAVLNDDGAIERVRKMLPAGSRAEVIQPSLEDVFIRMVETGRREG